MCWLPIIQMQTHVVQLPHVPMHMSSHVRQLLIVCWIHFEHISLYSLSASRSRWRWGIRPWPTGDGGAAARQSPRFPLAGGARGGGGGGGGGGEKAVSVFSAAAIAPLHPKGPSVRPTGDHRRVRRKLWIILNFENLIFFSF